MPTSRMVIIIVCLIVLASGGFDTILMSSQSYTTGYQGVKAQYYGIDWNDNFGKHGKMAFSLRGTNINFDPDQIDAGACNLVGEMTSVFEPESPDYKNWLPTEWLSKNQYIQNPIHHYEWEIYDKDENQTILYAMDEYQLKWYFSISADWQGDRERLDRRYLDTDVWFEFDLTPIWYFEGADKCYFCIAKLKISDLAKGGRIGDEKKEAKPDLRVCPDSTSSILSIYSKPFGIESERAEKTAHEFQGKKLNPDLFTDKVYSYFTLVNFGTSSWSEFAGTQWKFQGDVVTVGLDVHVFVVGEWKVKDIQQVPDEYGRTSQTGQTGGFLDFFFDKLGHILEDPRFAFWTTLGLIALVLLFLAIFAPAVLSGIIGQVQRSTRTRKGKG